jgi:hypothetical protein
MTLEAEEAIWWSAFLQSELCDRRLQGKDPLFAVEG